ncbi:MAG: DUF1330 domain-containing protein [Promethearchaeota archaeon]
MSKTIVVFLQFKDGEKWFGRELFNDGTILYAGYYVIPIEYSGDSEPDWDEIIVVKYPDEDLYNKAIDRLKAQESKIENYKVFLISLIPQKLFETINKMFEKYRNYTFESLPEDLARKEIEPNLSPKSFKRLYSRDISQPLGVTFFNKHHDVTEYPEDYKGEVKPTNGRAAYYEYAKAAIKLQGNIGGKMLIEGPYKATIISDKDETYDDFNIIWYPSLENFEKMLNSKEYQDCLIHREVGLEYSLSCYTIPYEEYS